MADTLHKNILATIMYYDGFQYPLTSFEIWRYLMRTDYYLKNGAVLNVTLSEIVAHLYANELNKYIEHYKGFYFLKGRKDLVTKRIENNKVSIKKIKRLERITSFLKFIPFVRMIGVTGALAMKNAKISSDWDLLVAFQQGKIWTGRTLMTLFLHFIGKRRHGEKISDRVCLNFFVTDQTLEVITKDLFSASEYMFMFPLYGGSVYTKFQIKNKWIKDMKPSYALDDIVMQRIREDTNFSKKFRYVGEKLFSLRLIEDVLRKIEKKRIMRNPKTNQEGSMVYANDDSLVFLPNPHGPIMFEKFKHKIEELQF
jgi:predicted nucleotidyltransferase